MGLLSDAITKAQNIKVYIKDIRTAISKKEPNSTVLASQGITWSSNSDLNTYDNAILAIDKATADIPSGTKFAHSEWTKIPSEIITYVSKPGNANNLFQNCTQLTQAGSSDQYLELGGKSSINSIFQGCISLTNVYIKGNQVWTSGVSAFQGCYNLRGIDFISYPNNVKDFTSMFEGCSSLSETINIPFSSATEISCKAMYKNSGLSRELGDYLNNESMIETTDEMFYNCSVAGISNINIPKCTSCISMFAISEQTLAKANLKTVGNIYSENCLNMSKMFYNQKWLETIESIDMKKCTIADDMFKGCYSIKKLVIKNLGAEENLKTLDLSDLTDWEEGINETITQAAGRSTPFTLKLSSTVSGKLTTEQISTLSGKNFLIDGLNI